MKKSIYKKLVSAAAAAAVLISGSVSVQAAPAQFLTHQTLPVWEKNLTVYDEDGNIVYAPAKTTFRTKDAENKFDFPAFSSDLTELGKELEIRCDIKTEKQQEWFDAVYEISRYEKEGPYSERTLSFDKRGSSFFLQPSRDLDYNRAYQIKIKARGFRNAHTVAEVVQPVKPELILTHFEAIKAGQDVAFNVKNFTYGIKNPIRQVQLIKILDGKQVSKKTLISVKDADSGFEYALIGNLLRVYGTALSEPAVYKLIVFAEGFYPFTTQFEVVENTNPDTGSGSGKNSFGPDSGKVWKVDGISSATSGGGDSGGGSGVPGGPGTQGTVLYNEDLLANALLLHEAGMATAESKLVSDRWKYGAIHDSAIDGDFSAVKRYDEYYNAVRQARLQGEYLTFARYLEQNKGDNPNRPYSLQQVLPGGTLGTDMRFIDLKGKMTPEFEVTGKTFGRPVEIRFKDGGEFLSRIQSVINNSAGIALPGDSYSVSGDVLTIAAAQFSRGVVTVRIYAEGYRTALIRFDYQPETTPAALVAEMPAHAGNPVAIKGFDSDFAANLKSVEVNGSLILSKEVQGNVEPEKDKYYELTGGAVVLSPAVVPLPGRYTVTLKAEHYPSASLGFDAVWKPDQPGGPETPDEPEAPIEDISFFAGASKDFFDNVMNFRVNYPAEQWQDLDNIKVFLNGNEKNLTSNFSIGKNDFKKSFDVLRVGFANLENSNELVIEDGKRKLMITFDKRGSLLSQKVQAIKK